MGIVFDHWAFASHQKPQNIDFMLSHKIWPPLALYLEKEMATHSSILAWRIPGMEEPAGLQSVECTELDMTEAT